MSELVEKLENNARFYLHESVALREEPSRRDNRKLGAEEAGTIASLLREAADALRHDLANRVKRIEAYEDLGM